MRFSRLTGLRGSPILRVMSKKRPLFEGLSRGLICAVLLALSVSKALANPDVPSDVVARFLADKGLVEAAAAESLAMPSAPDESNFVRQVRDRASDMVLTAMNFLGVRYQRGGTSEARGFDCSGFTRYIFEMSVGLVLPRRADEQAKAPGLIAIKRDELRPGDLVFFNTLKRTFSHVGIYVGESKFIHSPSAGGQVRVDDMRMSYWTKRFTGARRAELAPSALLGDVPSAVSTTSPLTSPHNRH